LFTRGFGQKIVVQSLESGEVKELIPGVGAKYLPSQHIVFSVENSLYATSFDHETLEVTGGSFPMVEDVFRMQGAVPQFAVSDSGTLLYIPGSISTQSKLEWYDRQGNKIGSIGEPAPYMQFSLSFDDKRLAIERVSPGGEFDIWVLELDRGGVGYPIASDPYNERDPIWSPDGNYIAFNSNKNGPDDLYLKSLAGEQEAELLLESEDRLVAEDWSDDGHYLVYYTLSDTGEGIWLLTLSDDKTSIPVLKESLQPHEAKLSPDGKWIAYNSVESGRCEVYIKPLEEDGERQIVSTNGGGQPQWRSDGKELFYLALDGSMMSAEIKQEPLKADIPEKLFQTVIAVQPSIDQYAVTRDGQRFLILNPGEAVNVSSINIVLNWFEELKQKVPVP